MKRYRDGAIDFEFRFSARAEKLRLSFLSGGFSRFYCVLFFFMESAVVFDSFVSEPCPPLFRMFFPEAPLYRGVYCISDLCRFLLSYTLMPNFVKVRTDYRQLTHFIFSGRFWRRRASGHRCWSGISRLLRGLRGRVLSCQARQ